MDGMPPRSVPRAPASSSPRAVLLAESRALARQDPVMARLVATYGPCRLAPRERGTHFAALARAIVYQQLAGSAAAAIHRRLVLLLQGRVAAETLLAAGRERLRGAGLSEGKARSLLDLAARVVERELRLGRIGTLADEDVIERLVAVRGIGRWTAEMFLMFQLRRLDVWPVGDYGVRKGFARAYGLAELPAPRALHGEGDRFRPYRSLAAWYCWRAAGDRSLGTGVAEDR